MRREPPPSRTATFLRRQFRATNLIQVKPAAFVFRRYPTIVSATIGSCPRQPVKIPGQRVCPRHGERQALLLSRPQPWEGMAMAPSARPSCTCRTQAVTLAEFRASRVVLLVAIYRTAQEACRDHADAAANSQRQGAAPRNRSGRSRPTSSASRMFLPIP